MDLIVLLKKNKAGERSREGRRQKAKEMRDGCIWGRKGVIGLLPLILYVGRCIAEWWPPLSCRKAYLFVWDLSLNGPLL